MWHTHVTFAVSWGRNHFGKVGGRSQFWKCDFFVCLIDPCLCTRYLLTIPADTITSAEYRFHLTAERNERTVSSQPMRSWQKKFLAGLTKDCCSFLGLQVGNAPNPRYTERLGTEASVRYIKWSCIERRVQPLATICFRLCNHSNEVQYLVYQSLCINLVSLPNEPVSEFGECLIESVVFTHQLYFFAKKSYGLSCFHTTCRLPFWANTQAWP